MDEKSWTPGIRGAILPIIELPSDLIRAMRLVFFLVIAWSLAPIPAVAQDATPPAAEVELRPGDVLSVEIWREEDLSGEFVVDRDGFVTLPLLGRRSVSGTPWPDVYDALLESYRDELRNPSINLTPLRRVYVLGEVHRAGLYTVDPTVSVAGAVALAGGANAQGDLRNLRVVREGQTVVEDVSAESALSSLDVRSGDQIFVGRRNWFERNSTFVITAALSLTGIVIQILR